VPDFAVQIYQTKMALMNTQKQERDFQNRLTFGFEAYQDGDAVFAELRHGLLPKRAPKRSRSSRSTCSKRAVKVLLQPFKAAAGYPLPALYSLQN